MVLLQESGVFGTVSDVIFSGIRNLTVPPKNFQNKRINPMFIANPYSNPFCLALLSPSKVSFTIGLHPCPSVSTCAHVLSLAPQKPPPSHSRDPFPFLAKPGICQGHSGSYRRLLRLTTSLARAPLHYRYHRHITAFSTPRCPPEPPPVAQPRSLL